MHFLAYLRLFVAEAGTLLSGATVEPGLRLGVQAIGDGDIDVGTCAKDSLILAWFENDGRGRFTFHRIHQDQAAYEVRLLDTDACDDLDMLAAGQVGLNVVWFEDRLKAKRRKTPKTASGYNFTPAREKRLEEHRHENENENEAGIRVAAHDCLHGFRRNQPRAAYNR